MEKVLMDYKELYIELAARLSSEGCYVSDDNYLGYAILAAPYRAFIHINASMNYRNKLFTLAHEAGHIFFHAKGNKWVWCENNARSEKDANHFAIQYLIRLEIPAKEYHDFYEKASKRKLKKPWHLL